MPRRRGLHEGGKDYLRRRIAIRPSKKMSPPPHDSNKKQENKRMKITRNKSSLQDQLAKMLQAGKENVDNSADNESIEQSSQKAPLHANAQAQTEYPVPEQSREEEPTPSSQQQELQPTPSEELAQEEAVEETVTPRSYRPRTTPARPRPRKTEEAPRLNASQRHEVPDRNAKFAGEPIKSVGCRMPQSLYARMLQYKALNDTQLNRITLNDIIIEAVDKYLSKIK